MENLSPYPPNGYHVRMQSGSIKRISDMHLFFLDEYLFIVVITQEISWNR